ncbi:MAG: AAA family ATPase [Nitrososphaerales archaeon]
MTISIAVTGKGGVGKTTIAALLVKTIHDKTGEIVLAVDADPNSNLHEALGVKAGKSIGDIREELLKLGEQIPPEQGKADYLEGLIEGATVEGEGFDLISMGRPEGPGCYCYVNHLLRKVLDKVSERYKFVVIDAEAGLEHFSRRTTRDVDILIVVSDPTARGFMTAKRVKELVSELNTKFGKMYMVVNRVPQSFADKVAEEAAKVGIECIALIPEDELVAEFDLAGKPLTSLPPDSKAYQAIQKIVEKLPLKEAEQTLWWQKI